MMRMVEESEWDLTALADASRRARLLNPPAPEALLSAVINEAMTSANNGLVVLDWQLAEDKIAPPNCYRLTAQIPIAETTFDQLFNGRSGYRAQYYLSSKDGEAFNRLIVDALIPVIGAAYKLAPLNVGFATVEASLHGAYSKIAIFGERDAFDSALEFVLSPPDWIKSNLGRGRRVPLPSHFSIDLKGTFIQNGTGTQWVDPMKLTRSDDLHGTGFT
jgi:hypothetical protein